MTSKLDKIVQQRREDVRLAKETSSKEKLQEMAAAVAAELGEPADLYEAIRAHQRVTKEMFVAAEFKRASPSKGDIATDLDVGEQASAYATGGAGLVSVLTEPKWFKGTLDDMLCARRAVNTIDLGEGKKRPLVLRKDFIIDEFQLYEARAFGADTVLLMLSILTESEVADLLNKARALGMEPLVEVVNEEETKAALRAGAKVLGVNNRNLHTFIVDMGTTPRIVDIVRAESQIENVAILALSGIKTRSDVKEYESHGDIAGLLVGETLMRAPSPGRMIGNLIRDGDDTPVTRVKVCGINDVESALVAAKAGADFIGIIFVQKSVRHASIETAKEIVKEIRAFRETESRVSLELPQNESPAPWFQAWGNVLGEVCDGQLRPLVVGVFMNQPIDEVNQIVAEVGLDLIQFHGNESKAEEATACVPSIRVVHVDSETTAAEDGVVPIHDDDLLDGPASAILLDTCIKGGASGGTGQTFDWAIAKQVSETKGIPVIMAGGLTPENVGDAVRASMAWGVDVASGVEQSPGKKDHAKIRAFIKAAKNAFL